MNKAFNFVAQARQVLEIEQQAIENLEQYLDDNFQQACEQILNSKGRVIVTGMGKSGHIGGKIAATLASTGTPAFFVHPGEASHGDLGMITEDDVVLSISNSGETQEILTLLPVLKRLGAFMISMTGNTQSTLATQSNIHICVKVEKEACPLGLAPTSSSTATLAMGDALAVALLAARDFTPEQFALSHPGGSLGRKLLLTLEDVMHTGKAIPMVEESASVKEALLEMTAKGLGMTAIVDADASLSGIFTDGDLRRILDKPQDLNQVTIAEVMTRHCKVATTKMLAAEALHLMESKKINGLIVVNDKGAPIGALNMHDLLKAGVV